MKNAALSIVPRLVAAATSLKDFVSRRKAALILLTAGLIIIPTNPAWADPDSQIPVQYGLCNMILGVAASPLGQIRGLGSLWPIGSIILLTAMVVTAIIPKARRAIMPNLLSGILWGVFGAAIVGGLIVYYGGELCA